jgi:hypothetical protein
VRAIDHREAFDREGGAGTISHERFEGSGEARHVAVVETDSGPGIDREPAGIPRTEVGGEEAESLVPEDESASHAFGQRCKVGRCDRPARQKRDACIGVAA